MKKTVYADNAATSPCRSTLWLRCCLSDRRFGNPSAIYEYGRKAKKVFEEGRAKVAEAIGALLEEIYFTGGGTEVTTGRYKRRV